MFLTPEELNTHIYGAIMDAISENDDTVVEAAINAAIAEAKSYLTRYDYEVLFAKEETDRDAILLMYIKDMAVWHFIVLANPNIDYESRKDRYQAAIAWLNKIQMGKAVPREWPLLAPEEKRSYFQYGSNPRRQSHY